MITVTLTAGNFKEFPEATRGGGGRGRRRGTTVATDEHNNLEVWAGSEGDEIVYVCADGQWTAVDIGQAGGS